MAKASLGIQIEIHSPVTKEIWPAVEVDVIEQVESLPAELQFSPFADPERFLNPGVQCEKPRSVENISTAGETGSGMFESLKCFFRIRENVGTTGRILVDLRVGHWNA